MLGGLVSKDSTPPPPLLQTLYIKHDILKSSWFVGIYLLLLFCFRAAFPLGGTAP